MNTNKNASNFLPPQSIEAEQSVLGAIFLEPKSFEVTSRIIQDDDFYQLAHQRVYSCMKALFDEQKGVDIVTVAERLKSQNYLEEIGGMSYLTELAMAVPTAANISYYAEIVFNKATLRHLMTVATEIVQECYTRQDELDTLLDDAERKILSVAKRKNTSTFDKLPKVLLDTYDKIEQLHLKKGGITGLATGFKSLDNLTAGFQKSDLIIVGARPSVGKTAFALNIAKNVAKQPENYHVAIFSLEMSAEQLAMRLLATEGNIELQKLRTGKLDDNDWKNLTMAVACLSKTNIYIDDSAGIKTSEIIAKTRRLKQENALDMIVIDYLQLIHCNSSKSGNRQQEVSDLSRQLKGLARELDVPIIALSQLSRGVELRQDKRPIMSDIRESGSIEQDADIVAFLYRDDYYDKETEDQNTIEIIIAKQRNGPVGEIKLGFKKEYNKFIDINFY